MRCIGKVVYADTFYSKKNDTTYTKLFVPVGNDVATVVTTGDYTHLAGTDNVSFSLRVKDNQLKLYYDGEED